MQNSTVDNGFTEAQIATIKRLAGTNTITDISRTIKAGFVRTKREMFRLGLISEFNEPAPKEPIPVEFFDYAKEYSYK